MSTVKVIRILQYEGTEEAVRHAIQLSKSLGVHQYSGYRMTVAEHLNELPELVEIPDERVQKVLEGELIPFVTPSLRDQLSDINQKNEDWLVEEHAKLIYNSWVHRAGWVTWVNGGNSTMQDKARAAARQDLKL